jgi:non-haem Fe2+, alpha-ketoglutarate-dependent halogenase
MEGSNHLDQRRCYLENGFLGPITVVSVEEATQAYREYQEWVETLSDQSVSGDCRFKPHLYLPFVNRLAHHPNMLELVLNVVFGEHDDVYLWSSDFNIKPPNSLHYFPPHQDSTYAGLVPPDDCVTVWLALSDPVSVEEGCLTFWNASHKLGQQPHIEGECNDQADPHNLLSRKQRLDTTSGNLPILYHSSPQTTAMTAIPLRAGQATVHNFLTVHQSGPNQSSSQRVGIAFRYINGNTVHRLEHNCVRESVTVIRSKYKHTTLSSFDVEPTLPIDRSPTVEEVMRGKEAHLSAILREKANYFRGSRATQYN